MKIIIRTIRDKTTVYLDGKPHHLEGLAKRCNITLSWLKEAILKPSIRENIRDWVIKAELGMDSKVRVYFHGEEYVFLADVVEHSECGVNSATKRIKQWMIDGDCDKLHRPVVLGRGPKKGVRYKHRHSPPEIIRKPVKSYRPQSRKAVEDLKPAGTWEMENLQ